MRKRRTKANAERYTALFLSHCSCGTILPVRQRRLCCLLCCSPAGYSWDQAERLGEGGSLIVPFLVHYSPPPSTRQKFARPRKAKDRRGGGGGSTVQTLCRLCARTTWVKLVFGTWQTQNITFCCCCAHYPTSSCLSPPSSAFPNTHHPDTHTYTYTYTDVRTESKTEDVKKRYGL